jgi:nitrogenase molybdenum-iron protein alpha chain
MSFLDSQKVASREKRIGTLSHYNGKFASLKEDTQGSEIHQRVRTFSQSCPDEVIYALKVLGRMNHIALVVHGSVGCSATGIWLHRDSGINWYSTNLTERDTILGGEEKLRKAVSRAYDEESPEAIFIIGTPVVAINNDDTAAVIMELQEEYGIPIVDIRTDGFKSKTPVNGYDIVLHALLRCAAARTPSDEKENFINVISLSESREDICSVVQILHELGIECQVIPQFSGLAKIRRAARAKASVVLHQEEGAYLAEELEEVLKVPYIRTDTPVGVTGTRRFIRKIARAFGIEKQAEAYLNEKEQEIQRLIRQEILDGKKVFLDIELSEAASLVNLVESLKGSVSGIAFSGVDLKNRELLKKLDTLSNTVPVVIANGQPFEKANLLSKTETDYYIARQGELYFAAEQGVVPVLLGTGAVLGYEGIVQFVQRIEKAESMRASVTYLSQNSPGMYRLSWLRKNSNWYVKQEVR